MRLAFSAAALSALPPCALSSNFRPRREQFLMSAAAAAAALVERAGRVDVLVANAGLPASGPLDGFSPAEIERALDVNLRAPMQLTRALLPQMVERGQGHLVFVSSLAGKVASVGSSLYSATKFGLRG